MVTMPASHPGKPRAAPPLHLLALLLLVVGQLGWAQGDATALLQLGVAGQPVAEAWNPLRLQLRDAPPSTLTLQIDQGTLRSGELPLTATFHVRGGAGIFIFQELLYLPRFASLSWRLRTEDRVLASGSVAGRDADDRPLDLLLSNRPGSYRQPYAEAFGGQARIQDISAADLPLDAAAYDGVRSLLIDGTVAAPRLEAVAAAASGGALVGLLGPLPASHDELRLLLGDAPAKRLGAGALLTTDGDLGSLLAGMNAARLPPRGELLGALLEQPLVEAPAPASQGRLGLMAAAYGLAVLLLLRWAAAPGLSAAVALALLLSLVGWRVLRPEAPQVQQQVSLALAGDGLGLRLAAMELLTLPRADYSVAERARPLRPQAYSVDDAGVHMVVDRWRTVLLALAPQLVDAPPRLDDDKATAAGDRGAEPWPGYLGLQSLLPEGSRLARQGCQAECVIWVVAPEPQLPAAPADQAAAATPALDPFHSATPAQQQAP